MSDTLPVYVTATFVLTIFLTIYCAYRAANRARGLLIGLLSWATVQGVLGSLLFFAQPDVNLFRLPLTIGLTVLALGAVFVTPQGRRFVDCLDRWWLTIIHTVRLPVELVLFWLSVYRLFPTVGTFEGRNLDIVMGITAPIVGYLWFGRKRLQLIWHSVGILFLINIIIIAALSLPTPFQQMAFDQPNVGLLYFPFNGLISVIVPLVLFAHVAAIRQLLHDPLAAKWL